MKKLILLIAISLCLYGCGVTQQIADKNEEIREDNPFVTPNVTVLVTDYTNTPLSGFYVSIPAVGTSNMSDWRGLCEIDSTTLTNNEVYSILVYDVANTVSFNYSTTVNITQTLAVRVNYKII